MPTFRAIAQAPLGDRGELGDHAQVGLGLGDDLRPLDLDRDQGAVVERGAMDLGGRRGGERLVLDRREQRLRLRSELRADDLPRLRPRETARRRSGAWRARSMMSAGSTSLRLAIICPIFT